ncbi:MAG TPA: hypothetical protein VHM70_08500 [Polyangiaceae bacterium]|jgi:hypothetical protein|nr:hypothetical protein [Polyangiaceae bacterium]
MSRARSHSQKSKRSSTRPSACVGVVEHSNRVTLVTIATTGELLDRRDVVLTEPSLSTHPHHHEGSWALGRYLNTPGAHPVPLAEVVALVERVRASAERGARAALANLASAVSVPIARIALRKCPPMPATIELIIADNRAQTVADSVMYRQAVARAASERGWFVRWYDRETAFADASRALGVEVDTRLRVMGRDAGPPWQAKHKLAAAVALAALGC